MHSHRGRMGTRNAISRALNKNRSLTGASIEVRNVRGFADTKKLHGTFKEPCNTCASVINQFDLKIKD